MFHEFLNNNINETFPLLLFCSKYILCFRKKRESPILKQIKKYNFSGSRQNVIAEKNQNKIP